jgi:hypothetical protein
MTSPTYPTAAAKSVAEPVFLIDPATGEPAAAGGGSLSAVAHAAALSLSEGASAPLRTDLAGNLVVADPALLAAAQDTTPIGVFAAGREYEFVAASDAGQPLGASGALGDTLDSLIIIPLTTSPGAVQIKDGSGGTFRTVFPGGASSVTSLTPFEIGLSFKSLAAGGWVVSTGANVQVFATGDFT